MFVGLFEKALSESAGGFSNRWPMPKWQSAAVATYLKTGKGFPNASLGYNVTGRAYPDIAAQVRTRQRGVAVASPPHTCPPTLAPSRPETRGRPVHPRNTPMLLAGTVLVGEETVL